MHFMVESTLIQPPTEETMALIPAEMARGLEVEAQGLRTMLYLAADFSKAWQVYCVSAQAQLVALLATFPLHPYMTYRITPLAQG